uniref:Uncharacterized protein n=2 Tax=Micrurus corallinus TaxID=54390 RepID=A0A2D4FWX5_MICCO
MLFSFIMQASWESTTSATSAMDRETKESREFPSSRLGPNKEVLLGLPSEVGSIFLPFSGERKLAVKQMDQDVKQQSLPSASKVGSPVMTSGKAPYLARGCTQLVPILMFFSQLGSKQYR